MSELNVQQKQKQSNSQLSYAQQQQSEKAHFWRNFITKANEFSKKIAIVDTFGYFFLLIVLLITMWIRPDLAAYCIQIVPYITTTVVSLRLAYAGKASLENYKKISASITTADTITTTIAGDDATSSESQG